MHRIVRASIAEILRGNPALLRIPVRQRATFEGWLKLELAHRLEQQGMADVEVESARWMKRDRTDVTFFADGEPYSLELKTPTTNWQMPGVVSRGRPITQNINAVIKDAEKLNSPNGIVAFVLSPIPPADDRWEIYLDRIRDETQLQLSRDGNCDVVEIPIDDKNTCALAVCAFMSRRFRNWT